jgi:predicted AAA+ superfamily ATPase
VRDCVRTALALNSIVENVKGKRLNIDGRQEEQAKKELQSAEDVLPRVARECYKWLLCPVQATPADRQSAVEAFPMNTSGSAFGAEIQRVCTTMSWLSKPGLLSICATH